MNDSRTHTYQVATLVDITETGITKYSIENDRERNQQRNLETIVQIFGLRTQLMRVDQTQIIVDIVAKYNFGTSYTGKHRIWFLEFDAEYQDVYRHLDNHTKILEDDIEQVPFITNLDESADFPVPVFVSDGEYKNIAFNLMSSNG